MILRIKNKIISHILIAWILSNHFSLIECQKKKIPLKSSPNDKNVLKSDAEEYNDNTTISLRQPAYGAKWHYGENWPQHGFPNCGQGLQSPIRLSTANAEEDSGLQLTLTNYNKPIRMAFIENNGHTVQLGFSDRFFASITGTAANDQKYIFKQMHFHWGSYNGVGAEHTIDGFRGPMEVHLVHYNRKYGNLDKAMDKEDGLMVLGVIFKISSRKNKLLSSIITLVKDVPKYRDKAFLLKPIILRTILPTYLKPYFVYSGSLTTPPCFESVRWIVFKHPVPISDAQEKQFRKTRSGYRNARTGRKRTISNNFRPIQAINERQILITA